MDFVNVFGSMSETYSFKSCHKTAVCQTIAKKVSMFQLLDRIIFRRDPNICFNVSKTLAAALLRFLQWN
jgi:hypothetical protein